MQIQPELSNGGAVSITIAHWLTPAGKLIHKVGITPDVVVEMSDADVEAGKDPQLDAAAQILLTGKIPEEPSVPQKNTEENGETGL
jgi:carboxyl-terminal processing protease